MSALPKALLFTLVSVASCRTGDRGPADAEARARAVLGPFKASLKEALTTALAEGPEKAVEACAAKAPALAKAASKDGVTVGRTSTRLRNPANAAPAWVVPLLAELATEKSGTEAKRTVALGGGRYGYAEAIWIQPPCLGCHGATVAPGVASALARYPDDQAKGYALGELRGVFYAEIAPR